MNNEREFNVNKNRLTNKALKSAKLHQKHQIVYKILKSQNCTFKIIVTLKIFHFQITQKDKLHEICLQNQLILAQTWRKTQSTNRKVDEPLSSLSCIKPL